MSFVWVSKSIDHEVYYFCTVSSTTAPPRYQHWLTVIIIAVGAYLDVRMYLS